MSVADRLAERKALYAFMQAGGSLEDVAENLQQERMRAIQDQASKWESELKVESAASRALDEERMKMLASLDPLKAAEDQLKQLAASVGKFVETNNQLVDTLNNGVKQIEKLQVSQQEMTSALNKQLKHERQFDEANAKIKQFGQEACKQFSKS